MSHQEVCTGFISAALLYRILELEEATANFDLNQFNIFDDLFQLVFRAVWIQKSHSDLSHVYVILNLIHIRFAAMQHENSCLCGYTECCHHEPAQCSVDLCYLFRYATQQFLVKLKVNSVFFFFRFRVCIGVRLGVTANIKFILCYWQYLCIHSCYGSNFRLRYHKLSEHQRSKTMQKH